MSKALAFINDKRVRDVFYQAALLIGLLLLYATLVRINAVFATVPLAFGLLGAGTWRRPVRRGAMMLAATVALTTPCS